MEKSQIPNISFKDFLINQPEPEREQTAYVSFWMKHINYCKSGVYVGGVYISGWLYWHLNFFKLSIDKRDEFGNSVRVVTHPNLRDNEWLINWCYEKADSKGKEPILAFGTRRFAKTSFISSRVAYNTFIFQYSNPLIIGGSQSDLNNITKYLDEFYERRPDCFSDFVKINDWNKATSSDVEIEFNKRIVTKGRNPINPISYEFFPINEKPNDNSFAFSRVSVRNLQQGQVTSKEELLAGITPTEAVWDEVGKYLYSKQRSALLPAIENDLGERRFVELLIGTGGNTDFAADAEMDFLNTEKSNFFHFDVEEYLKDIKDEHFRYHQDTDKKVSLFVPAQMSNKGGQKREIPLVQYLNRDFTAEQVEALDGFNIFVTDWDIAHDKVNDFINSEHAKSPDKGKKAQMYYPFQPEDCFLFSGNNPFPVEQAKKAQDIINIDGKTGEYVSLDIGPNGLISVIQSSLEPVTEYPFKGGAYESPCVIYERPIFDNPRQIKRGTYVAGFDGAKVATSTTSDSLNCLYIFKRQAGVSGYQNQIVAQLTGRPHMDAIYYRQAMLLLRLYNAECLPEADVPFVKYLRSQKADYLLAQAKGTNLRINENSRANVDYGLPATARNKEHLLKLLKNYCWEQIPTGEIGPDGEEVTVLGVERITDPMLLEEIIKFGNYKNYDRIMSFGHALIWDEELSINNITGSESKYEVKRDVYTKLTDKKFGRSRFR
jgi:hypothetical protein